MNEQEVTALTTTTQAITPEQFKKSFNDLIVFTKKELKLDKDFGVIPGTNKKSLFKPGAEKIAFLFGLKPEVELMDKVEDWDNGFFFYRYKANLVHFGTGKNAGSAERGCNSKEKKYAFTVKPEKWATEDEKKRALSRKQNKKYAGSYDLILRKTPDESADQANTIMAMAQKRAIVAAVVQSTMASEIFDADVSEYEEEAPDKSTTKEEDPRRHRLLSKLYVTAGEHGWTDVWIHKAVTQKWKVDSLTNISNDQLDELTEFIVTKYIEVGKGNKPVLRETITVNSANETAKGVKVTSQESVDRIEAEIVESEKKEVKYCRNKKKHGDEEVIVPQGSEPDYFCNKSCQDEYWGESTRKQSKLDEFIAKGKQKKAAEEAQ